MKQKTAHQIVEQLALTFTARDIMVDVADLIKGKDSNHAQELLEMYPQYNVIPIPDKGDITGYHRRGTNKGKIVTSQDLISDGTPLVDLPDLLRARDFFFVLASNRITGFIHFSDLNNSIIKLPYFVLFEAVERSLWQMIESKISEEDVKQIIFDQARIETVLRKRDRARDRDVDLGWSGILYFDEIVRLACYYGKCNIEQKDRELLADYRNRVAHTDKLLIQRHADTRKLAEVKKLCYLILNL